MVASAAGHSPYLDALPSALPQIGEIDGSVAERRHVPILRQEDTLLQHRLVVTQLHHQSRRLRRIGLLGQVAARKRQALMANATFGAGGRRFDGGGVI